MLVADKIREEVESATFGYDGARYAKGIWPASERRLILRYRVEREMREIKRLRDDRT